MKDVVFLSAQVEKLTQMNQQLTEEISSLHSQLEQERSRSHVALLELRRLEVGHFSHLLVDIVCAYTSLK